MDWSDVFLAAAKMCNYLRKETAASVVFAIFVGVWTCVDTNKSFHQSD